MLGALPSVQKKEDTNLETLSDVTCEGTPCLEKTVDIMTLVHIPRWLKSPSRHSRIRHHRQGHMYMRTHSLNPYMLVFAILVTIR